MIILVYTIILISKTGNPTRLFQHHDYSRRESTATRKTLKVLSNFLVFYYLAKYKTFQKYTTVENQPFFQ